MNTLTKADRIRVVAALVEGNSIRATSRMTGIARNTVTKLLVDLGAACMKFHDAHVRNVRVRRLQCDEIWTFVLKKQGKLKPEEQEKDNIGDQFLFVALDQKTKLVPTYTIGKRTRENTEAFMLDLSGRVNTPRLGEEGFRPLISTDGFNAYPGAVDLAFADTARHGVLIKDYANNEQPGRYGPPEMVGETRIPMSAGINENEICTSHVERNNLTIRTFMRRFTPIDESTAVKICERWDIDPADWFRPVGWFVISPR